MVSPGAGLPSNTRSNSQGLEVVQLPPISIPVSVPFWTPSLQVAGVTSVGGKMLCCSSMAGLAVKYPVFDTDFSISVSVISSTLQPVPIVLPA